MKCLLASCYIPLYSGTAAPELDGEPYIDGGYTEVSTPIKSYFNEIFLESTSFQRHVHDND